MTRNKLQRKIALQEDPSLQARGNCGCERCEIYGIRGESWSSKRRRHTGTRRGRRRQFEHEGPRGTGGNTFWESGKTIRHLTQEDGQDTWNERGKLVIFKIKQEMTRQDMKKNLNRDKGWIAHSRIGISHCLKRRSLSISGSCSRVELGQHL